MKFKFTRSDPRHRIAIPHSVNELSGLNNETALEVHVLDGSLLVTKSEMTAMDIVNLITALSNLATDLIMDLGVACGSCDSCGYCDHIDLEDERIHLPSHVLEEAGLPSNCKFIVGVEDGAITVTPAGHDFDLTDVPPDMLDMFKKSGICIHELEDYLINDGIIYGVEKPKEDDNNF